MSNVEQETEVKESIVRDVNKAARAGSFELVGAPEGFIGLSTKHLDGNPEPVIVPMKW